MATGLEPKPPIPVAAVYLGGLPPKARVFFDTPLVEGALDPSTWDFWWMGANPPVQTATAAGRYVELAFTIVTPINGTSKVSHTPPPYDVVSARTLAPSPGFADFPVT